MTAIVSLYESFALEPFGGNVAGVVLCDALPDARTLLGLARDLAAPTTGFLVVDEQARNGVAHVRFFTPRQEIDGCGHVTLAVAACLVAEGVWTDGVRGGCIECAGGSIPIRVSPEPGSPLVELRYSVKERTPAAISATEVGIALGATRIRNDLPLEIVSTGLQHLIVPVVAPADLSALRLNVPTVAELATRSGADTICVWASGREEDVYVRDLCARVGDLEEPASGTTSAALTAYLANHMGRRRLQVHQGIEMGRPSLIETVVLQEGTIAVRGRATRVLRGELMLPAFGGRARRDNPHRAPADGQPRGLLPPRMS